MRTEKILVVDDDAAVRRLIWKALQSTGILIYQSESIEKTKDIVTRVTFDLFILDEPTTGMDEESRNEFYRLLRHSAHDHGKSVLMITHDHEDIKQYADRQIRLVRKEDSPWRCFHMNS